MKAAFYKSTRPSLKGIYNQLVRAVDGSQYSHCEIQFSDGISASSSFEDDGVRFKHIVFNPDHWDFIDLPDELEAGARAWFEAHKGAKYDIMGNIRFVLGFVPHSRGKWFCTEAAAESLGIAGSWLYGPRALYAQLNFEYGE